MEAEKNFSHVQNSLISALASNRTYNDIWFIKDDNNNEAKQYITEMRPVSLIVNKLPQLDTDDNRYSLLITYLIKDKDVEGEAETRTRAYICDASSDQSIDDTARWLTNTIERVGNDLFGFTYDVDFAITEHIVDPKEFSEKVLNTARKILGDNSEYCVHCNMPKYAASLLRVKETSRLSSCSDYTVLLDKMVEVFSLIHD